MAPKPGNQKTGFPQQSKLKGLSQSGRKKSSGKSASGPSDYSIHKDFGGYQNFMHSWGLKIYNMDDVEEGKAITEAFKEADRQAARDAAKTGGSGNAGKSVGKSGSTVDA